MARSILNVQGRVPWPPAEFTAAFGARGRHRGMRLILRETLEVAGDGVHADLSPRWRPGSRADSRAGGARPGSRPACWVTAPPRPSAPPRCTGRHGRPIRMDRGRGDHLSSRKQVPIKCVLPGDQRQHRREHHKQNGRCRFTAGVRRRESQLRSANAGKHRHGDGQSKNAVPVMRPES